MKIYISGKISGQPIDYTRQRFEDAEALLECIGFEVVNPMRRNLQHGAGWGDRIVRDIELLMGCDAIYMMDNWRESTGARIEYDIAKRVGKHVLFESAVRDESADLMRIRNAIHEVLGLRFNDYTTKSRKRDGVFARMLFVYHCRKCHMKLSKIAMHVQRDHSSILHLLKKYDDEVRFNPYFRKVARMVDDILNKTRRPDSGNG